MARYSREGREDRYAELSRDVVVQIQIAASQLF